MSDFRDTVVAKFMEVPGVVEVIPVFVNDRNMFRIRTDISDPEGGVHRESWCMEEAHLPQLDDAAVELSNRLTAARH